MRIAIKPHRLKGYIIRTLVTMLCVMNFTSLFCREILIITSYNPDTPKTFSHLTDFTEEIKRRFNGKVSVAIESMNCGNLSEAYLWKSRMAGIIDAHKTKKPDMIILLGQEAWAAYLSQDSKLAKETPCMAAMVSSYTIILPDYKCDFHKWKPKGIRYTSKKDFNIVGGIFYKYDIDKNINLVRDFYPKTKKIALITDFSFGGLVLQSHVIEKMREHKDIELQLLDGRENSIFEMCDKLRRLTSPNTIVWVGTWRIDSSENFVLANTTETLHSANKNIPAFSLSSAGLGNWTIGGYIPEYSPQGKKLADIASDYLSMKNKNFIIIPNEYSFDQKKLNKFKLYNKQLPKNSVIINTPSDFFSSHKTLVLWVLGILLILCIGLLFSLYYISKIKRLTRNLERQSKELKEAKDIAEEANNIKTSFIANMSHEIRTPLNAIVGFTDLITQDDCDDNDKKTFSHIIKENSDMLLELINQILDISCIESGKISISKEACNVTDICHTAVVSVEHARKTNGVKIIEEYPDEVVTARTDALRLKQVIINLLTNAYKFTKEGFIKLSISIDSKNNVIVFCVKDTGIGIPADKADDIFKRFVKLNQYVQGTGLGLSLSKIIVESLGGKIWLDTSYHDGACFMFTHPIETT